MCVYVCLSFAYLEKRSSDVLSHRWGDGGGDAEDPWRGCVEGDAVWIKRSFRKLASINTGGKAIGRVGTGTF